MKVERSTDGERWTVNMDQEEAASLRHLVAMASEAGQWPEGTGFEAFVFISQLLDGLPSRPR